MTTEAQTEANRANAQKSTGPRTPEGKEKAAQNALKHGLLAKEAVVVGEDFDQFDLYRDRFRAELAPVGLPESLLVERIVGLSWRLQRAERFHTEAFDTLYMKLDSDPRAHPADVGPDRGDPIFGETVVQDFSETRVLERLMVYERRIENSLYRTMAELRQVQGLRQGVGGGPLRDRRPRRSREEEDRGGPFHRVRETLPADFTLDNLLARIAALEEGPQTRGDAFGNPEPPAGAATNAPAGPSCETNPICVGPCDDPALGTARGEEVGRGRPTHEEPPDGGTTNLPMAQSQLCETKPISEEASSAKCQVSGETCETNPICGGPRSMGILPVNRNHGRDAHATGYRPIFRRRR